MPVKKKTTKKLPIKKTPIFINDGNSFGEMIKKAVEKQQARLEKFDGTCDHCHKGPADPTSTIDPMHCKACNDEIEVLLKQLRGPGFIEMKIPIN
jgi:hypothetical protein